MNITRTEHRRIYDEKYFIFAFKSNSIRHTTMVNVQTVYFLKIIRAIAQYLYRFGRYHFFSKVNSYMHYTNLNS